MALTLTIERARWRAHLADTLAAFPDVVPVVKGNGYGFGRTYLAELVSAWAAEAAVDEIAVGTVHELAGLLPDGPRPLVLTPALGRELAPGVGPSILTVGNLRHVNELAATGLRPPVVVKLASGMRRYGAAPAEVVAVIEALATAQLPVHGYAVHPPLAGTAEDRATAVAECAALLPEGSTVYVSHLDAAAYSGLRHEHPEHRWRIRLGTALWHGDKSFLRLRADVLDVRAVAAGDRAGYRLVEVPADGHLVLITARSAHGVAALPGGSSPFHYDRRRLALLEPPHMHTSMAFVPCGEPVPDIGDHVDVQRPLTQTLVDRIVEV